VILVVAEPARHMGLEGRAWAGRLRLGSRSSLRSAWWEVLCSTALAVMTAEANWSSLSGYRAALDAHDVTILERLLGPDFTCHVILLRRNAWRDPVGPHGPRSGIAMSPHKRASVKWHPRARRGLWRGCGRGSLVAGVGAGSRS
jgi:hypothetical protein